MGIGTIPDFVLSLLRNKKVPGSPYRVVCQWSYKTCTIKELLPNTKKNVDVSKIVATLIFGTKKHAQFVHNNDDVLMMPVDYTNNPCVIAQNNKVVSIEFLSGINLLGQVN